MGVLLMVLVIGASFVRAQDSYRQLALIDPRPRCYDEAFAWPGADSVELGVAFRIPNTQLVFEQTPRGFEATAEVVVRVLRGDEEVASHSWRATHRETSFEATQDRLRDVQGFVPFALPPGPYTYTLEAGEQTRLRPRSRPPGSRAGRAAGPVSRRDVTLDAFEGATVGKAVMLRQVERGERSMGVELANLGGDVPFAQPARVLVPLVVPRGVDSAGARLEWRLVKVAEHERHPGRDSGDTRVPGLEMASGTVQGAAFVALPALADVQHDEGWLRWQLSGEPAAHAALIDLGGERLPDGAYILETTLVTDGDTARTDTHFGTHWRDQPLALYHSEVAIEVLRFIAERDMIGRLRNGSRQEQAEKLRAFWAERDPTPSTPFNELMAEYYRRIDHAAHAYRTGVVPGPDGLETDRARIYVTMGPPEDVVRRLPDRGGVEETWTYPDGHRFVFRAATSYDAYRLVE